MAKNTSFIKLLQEKQGFLIAVYLTLIVQLFVTFAIVYQFRNHPSLSKATKQSFIIYFLLSFGLILLITLVPMPPWMKLVLFTLFAITNGAMLHQSTYKLPESLITQALGGTIGVFVCMTIAAVVLAIIGIDLSWMGLLFLGAFIGLLIASLILMFTSKSKEEKKNSKFYKKSRC